MLPRRDIPCFDVNQLKDIDPKAERPELAFYNASSDVRSRCSGRLRVVPQDIVPGWPLAETDGARVLCHN